MFNQINTTVMGIVNHICFGQVMTNPDVAMPALLMVLGMYVLLPMTLAHWCKARKLSRILLRVYLTLSMIGLAWLTVYGLATL